MWCDLASFAYFVLSCDTRLQPSSIRSAMLGVLNNSREICKSTQQTIGAQVSIISTF
jgi:hypothetical protein